MKLRGFEVAKDGKAKTFTYQLEKLQTLLDMM